MAANPTPPAPPPAISAPEEKFALTSSRHFPDWLARAGASPRLHHLPGRQAVPDRARSRRPPRGVRAHLRALHGAGVGPDARSLAGDPVQLLRFDNVVPKGGAHGEHDAVFSPHVAWITGDVDVHDMAIGPDGRPVFVNTLFSCIATVSEELQLQAAVAAAVRQRSWRPRTAATSTGWRSRTAGRATSPLVAKSDVADGWRDRRADGGMLMDVATGQIVCCAACRCRIRRACTRAGSGCSTPAPASSAFSIAMRRNSRRSRSARAMRAGSPSSAPMRWSGSRSRARTAPSRACRSTARSPRAAPSRAAVLVIDTRSGDTVEWLRIEGVVRELFDVAVLPGVRNPAAIGFVSDEIQRLISIDEVSPRNAASRGPPVFHPRSPSTPITFPRCRGIPPARVLVRMVTAGRSFGLRRPFDRPAHGTAGDTPE